MNMSRPCEGLHQAYHIPKEPAKKVQDTTDTSDSIHDINCISTQTDIKQRNSIQAVRRNLGSVPPRRPFPVPSSPSLSKPISALYHIVG